MYKCISCEISSDYHMYYILTLKVTTLTLFNKKSIREPINLHAIYFKIVHVCAFMSIVLNSIYKYIYYYCQRQLVCLSSTLLSMIDNVSVIDFTIDFTIETWNHNVLVIDFTIDFTIKTWNHNVSVIDFTIDFTIEKHEITMFQLLISQLISQYYIDFTIEKHEITMFQGLRKQALKQYLLIRHLLGNVIVEFILFNLA